MSQVTKITDLELLTSEIKLKNLADKIKKVEPKMIDISFYNRLTEQWETYAVSLDQFNKLALGF